MITWTDQDLLRLDAEFAQAGVAMHARPIRAAMSILGSGFVIGVLSNPDVDRVMEDYRRVFPQVDEAWPGKGVGLAASVDTVRKMTVAVIFGTCSISVHQSLGFQSHEEWVRWCRGDTAIAACSALAFADLYDLTYGVDDGKVRPPSELWRMALSNLEDVANILASGFSVDSVVQPICLTAELSMKAALIDLGADPKVLARREVGHNHEELARRLAALSPHRDDPIVAAVTAALPRLRAQPLHGSGTDEAFGREACAWRTVYRGIGLSQNWRSGFCRRAGAGSMARPSQSCFLRLRDRHAVYPEWSSNSERTARRA